MFHVKLSVHNEDISGYLDYDKLACPPGATFASPFPNHLEEERDILNNKSLSAAYRLPPHPVSKFKSQLLSTVKFPNRKLSWTEVVQAFNFHRRTHPHILVGTYGAQAQLTRPPGMPSHPEVSENRVRPAGRGAYSYPIHGHHTYYPPSASRSHPPSTSSTSTSTTSSSSVSYQYTSDYPPRHSNASSTTGSFAMASSHGRASARGSYSMRGRGYASQGAPPPPVRAGSHTWRSPSYQPPASSTYDYHHHHQQQRGNITYHRSAPRGSSTYRTDAYSIRNSSGAFPPNSRSHYSAPHPPTGNPERGATRNSGIHSMHPSAPRGGSSSSHLTWSRPPKRGRSGRPPPMD